MILCVSTFVSALYGLVSLTMPRKFTKRRRYSRKRSGTKRRYTPKRSGNKYGRNGMRAQSVATGNATGFGFPKQKIVKMRYVGGQVLGFDDASYVGYVMRANSVNDPDYTGGGHQPLGMDQWAQFYDYYCVLGSTCKVTFSQLDGAPQKAIACGIYIDDTAVDEIEEFSYLAESGRAAWQVVNPNGGNTAGYNAQKTVKANFGAKKFFNVADVKDNVLRIGAVMGANPNDSAYYRIFMATVDESDISDTHFNLLIEMDFTVMFSEPKTLPQS